MVEFYENDIKQEEKIENPINDSLPVPTVPATKIIGILQEDQGGTGSTDGGSSVGGSDTQVQFNDGGTISGDAGLTYNKTTDTLTLGNIAGLTSEALDIDAADFGSGSGTGLALNITSGDGGSAGGAGGAVNITAGGGLSGGAGGALNLNGGLGNSSASGGDINILPGGSGSGTPGIVLIQLNSGSIDKDAVKITTTQGGADDPTLQIRQGRVVTTNATLTSINEITLVDNETYLIEARIVARRTGGTAGTDDDGAGYIIAGTFKTAATVATQIGTTTVIAAHEDQAGWDVQFNEAGVIVKIQVQGAADNTITWHSTVFIKHLSS